MDPRYQRNLGALTEEECGILRQKKIFIAGCGGLGGHLLEYFLRVGVGGITACDGDSFDETNLNRQLLSKMDSIGSSKAEAAAQRAKEINPDVDFSARGEFLTAENAEDLLRGHDLVLDALDSVESRRILASACARLGIPLVHGAIQGWQAQVAVIPPGSTLLDILYPSGQQNIGDKSSLSFAPGLCAAMQAAEGIKLLCGRPSSLEGKILFADLLTQSYRVLSI